MDENIEKLGIMLQENPEDVSLLRAYGDSSMLRGRFIEALQAYEKLIAREPAVASHYLSLVNIFLLQQQPNDAVAIFELAAQQEASGTELYLIYKRLQDLALVNELPEWETFKADPEVLTQLLFAFEGGIKVYEEQIQDFQGLLDESDDPVIEYLLAKTSERKAALDSWSDLATKILGAPLPAAPRKAELPKVEPEKYQKLQSAVIQILERFISTKGVSGVCLADLEGLIVSKIFKEENLALKCPEVLAKFISSADLFKGEHFNYWVLEYEHGLLMFKYLSGQYLLLISGIAGTNFGALRYIIDKSQEELLEILT